MSENKKTFIASKVAPAGKDTVRIMVDALKGTAGLNAKVIYGCRYLQVRIHSKVTTECTKANEAENQPNRIFFKWNIITANGGCAEFESVRNILQNSEIPLWARRYIASFFKNQAKLPIIIKQSGGKTYFDLDTSAGLILTEVEKSKAKLESQWNKIEEGVKPNCIGNSYPDIIPEDSKYLKAPNPRKQKTTMELISAFSKKMNAIEDDTDANAVGEVLDFLFKEEDNKEIHDSKINLLLMITKATRQGRKDLTKYISNGMRTVDGAPKVP